MPRRLVVGQRTLDPFTEVRILAGQPAVRSGGDVPEWLGSGLQNRVHGFDSRRRLQHSERGVGQPALRGTSPIASLGRPPSRFVLVLLVMAAGCGVGPPSSAPGTSLPPSPSASTDPCSSTEVTVQQLMGTDERLECFGGRSVSFRAYVSGMAAITICSITPVPGDGWLDLCAGTRRLLVASPGDEDGVPAFIPPEMSAFDVPADRWVDVLGHFDDPAAQTCGVQGGQTPDPQQVQACRAAFVLEQAFPAE